MLNVGWQDIDVENAFNMMPQAPIRPKERQWKKITLIIFCVIIILAVGFLFFPRFLNLFAKDISPINDSDLSLKAVIVSDNDNAYFDLIKLDSAISEPKGKSQIILDMVAGKTWDDELAEEIISLNAQAFGYFAEAAGKLKFQDPALADPANITPNIILPAANNWRRMARLSVIRAMYLAKQGKDKEAMDEALNSVRVGQKIQDSQVVLIEYLVAIAMKEIGLDTVQKIISPAKLSSSELKQYAQELNQYYKNEDGLIMAFKAEYHSQSGAIDLMASGNSEVLKLLVGEEESQKPEFMAKMKDTYYFQPNKTKLFFADYARSMIKGAEEACGEIKLTEIKKLAPTNPVKLYAEENAIGKILHDVMAVSLTGVSTKKCQEDLLVGATQALVAIKAYRNDTNNYPASLNELVPTYLSTIPQDPFDGKSLKYSAAKMILYSVGQDIQDLGGSTGADWKNMTNPTFNVNFSSSVSESATPSALQSSSFSSISTSGWGKFTSKYLDFLYPKNWTIYATPRTDSPYVFEVQAGSPDNKYRCIFNVVDIKSPPKRGVDLNLYKYEATKNASIAGGYPVSNERQIEISGLAGRAFDSAGSFKFTTIVVTTLNYVYNINSCLPGVEDPYISTFLNTVKINLK